MSTLVGLLLLLIAVFLIMLVLVQRGRGGGLAGALGGMGGQSAFGAKAGDVFTKITIWTAVVWIMLCAAAVKWLGVPHDDFNVGGGVAPADGASSSAPIDPSTLDKSSESTPAENDAAPPAK